MTAVPIVFWLAVAGAAVATFGPGGTDDGRYSIMWFACLPVSVVLGPMLAMVAYAADDLIGTSSWVVLPVAWMGIAAIQAGLIRLLMIGMARLYRRCIRSPERA